MLNIFSCVYWTFVYLLQRNYSDVLPVFKFGHFCCCRVAKVLYIFWLITPLPDMWFANIFSHSVGYGLIFLIVSRSASVFKFDGLLSLWLLNAFGNIQETIASSKVMKTYTCFILSFIVLAFKLGL